MKIAPHRTDVDPDGSVTEDAGAVVQEGGGEAQKPSVASPQANASGISFAVEEGRENDDGGEGNDSGNNNDGGNGGGSSVSSLQIPSAVLGSDTDIVLALVACLAKNRSVPSAAPRCDVSLRALTKKDTLTLSQGMQYFLVREMSEEDAFERFIQSYPSMAALNSTYGGFEEALTNVCIGILSDKQKWAKLKLIFAAALSIGDLFTDVLMVFEFLSVGEDRYAWATLACLLSNLALVAIGTFLNNKGRSRERQIKEQVYVWMLVKPGVDAWRLASGAQDAEGQPGNAMVAYTFSKGAELFAEAIPGSVIQMSAIMKTGSKTTNSAAFSFVFCILTAAFTASTLSWEWDVNKDNRRKAPFFYGYVPRNLDSKIAVFISLFALSLFNLFVRSLTFIIFDINGGGSLVAMIMGAELFLCLAIKRVRGDLAYWMPVYGFSGIVLATIARTMASVIASWTALVQMRHPNEVGGAYFTFGLCLSIAMGIVAALQYEKVGVNGIVNGDVEEEGVNEGEERGLEKDTVVTSMIIACVGIVTSYATLLISIKRKFLNTFLSTKTSNEISQEYFTKNEGDEERFEVLADNRYKWEYKIGPDVRAWIDERLPVWLEEEPEWFNDQRRSIIPDDFVTDLAILARLRTKNVEAIIEQRRRSSLGLIFVPGGDVGEEEERVT